MNNQLVLLLVVGVLTLGIGAAIGYYAIPRPEVDEEGERTRGTTVRFQGMGVHVQDGAVTEVAYRVYSTNAGRPSRWRCATVENGRAVDRPPNMTEFRDVYRVEIRYRKNGAWSETVDCTGPCSPGPCVSTACGTITPDGSLVGFNCEGRDCPNPFANTKRSGTCDPGP